MQERNAVREGYDEVAGEYLKRRSLEPSATTPLNDLRERLPEGARVLDAGCGAGRPVASQLSERFTVVGVDFSREQLRLAREHVPGETFTQQDMTALAFAEESFDAICALYSIIHVPTDQHPEVFAEFSRVLRPGGLLLCSVGGEAWAGTNPDWLDAGVEMHWSFPDEETSVRQLAAAGFAVLDRWELEDELGGSFPFLLARTRLDE